MNIDDTGLKVGTLCFFVRDYKVLLARKTRSIGEGTLNGYGGGIEGAETIEECCAREVFGECKVIVDPKKLRKFGIVYFHNLKENGEFFVCEIHVFIATEWGGLPQPSVEMANPKWHLISVLPFDEMMPADRFWVPKILLFGKKIIAHAYQDLAQKKLLRPVEIKEVNSFSEDD